MQSATTPTPTPLQPGGGQSFASVLPQWLQFPGWRWVLAALIVAIGVIVSRYVVRLVGRPIAKRFQRQSVAQIALRLVRLGVILVAIGSAASVLGLQAGDIVLSVTVFSAVLGIVLAPIVGSTINGLFLLADQPFEIGDMIELDDGKRGFVDDITIRYTKMFTLDNTFLIIPNSAIREHFVTNYSAEDERVRLSLEVVVTYESDIDQAQRLMRRAAAADDDVLKGGPDIRVGSARYPARPTVLESSFGDDGVVLKLRYWAKKPYKIPTVESRIRGRIWDAFKESDADIEFAYPHRHLIFDETSGTLDASVERREGRRGSVDDGSIQTAFENRGEEAVGFEDDEAGSGNDAVGTGSDAVGTGSDAVGTGNKEARSEDGGFDEEGSGVDGGIR